MPRRLALTALLATTLACQVSPPPEAASTEAAHSPPLLDGRCEEYPEVGAAEHALPHGITLWVFEDRSFVWLCYGLPDGSYGTLDLRIESPALKRPLNLHVSAQIGEWPADQAGAAPDSPASDEWWNHDGWFANAVYFADVDPEAGASFRPSGARELQLSKERFGRGPWRLNLEIRAVATDEGLRTITFPGADDQEEHLVVEAG